MSISILSHEDIVIITGKVVTQVTFEDWITGAFGVNRALIHTLVVVLGPPASVFVHF